MTRLRRSDADAASARQVQKELRALAPPFAVTLLIVVGFAVVGDARWGSFALAAYFFGTASLGAISVGHEYTYRTLPMLLAQPVKRVSLLRAKLIVLVPMLLALGAVATRLPFEPFDDELAMVWMAPLAALVLAPWLTMLCRNPIAGIAFSAGIPGGTFSLCNLLALLLHGDTPAAAALTTTLYSIAGGATFVAGAILGVRKFLALEVIEGRDAPLQLPRWRRSSPDTTSSARPPNAVWMLVQKELRLQQMAFVVAAVSVAMFSAIWLLIVSGTAEDHDVFTVVSVLYALMLAVLIGSLSCAEERHLGTIDWQIMLPFPSSLQWAIKVAVALTLAVVLSVGIPSLFARGFDVAQPQFIGSVVLITSLAIYISSRSASGIQALLISFAIAPVAVFLVRAFVGPQAYRFGGVGGITTIGVMLAVVALRLGLIHYRTLQRSSAR